MTEDSVSPSQTFFATLLRGRPLAVLGAPALADAEGLKEAYLRKVAKHPPHEDPAAFRRIRQAFEALSVSGAREAASLMAPPDPDWLHREFVAPLDEALQCARPDAAEAGRGDHDPYERWGRRGWAEISGT